MFVPADAFDPATCSESLVSIQVPRQIFSYGGRFHRLLIVRVVCAARPTSDHGPCDATALTENKRAASLCLLQRDEGTADSDVAFPDCGGFPMASDHLVGVTPFCGMSSRIGKATRWASNGTALVVLVGALGGVASRDVTAAALPVVTPTMACADLLKIDFTGLEDAPTKLDSAVVLDASASVPTQECVVTGYVAPKVRFTVRMPTQNWTQRLLTKGCGGYCGDLIAPTPTGYDAGGNSGAAVGCPFVNSGEIAIVAHNGGHTGNTNAGRFLAAIADGMPSQVRNG